MGTGILVSILCFIQILQSLNRWSNLIMFYCDVNNYENTSESFDMYKGVSCKGLATIFAAQELLKKEQEEVKRHQALLKLTTKNLVDNIKRSVQYSWVDATILENAQKWLVIKKNCDKRRKYVEKDAYDAISKKIAEALEIENVKILNITQCGLECYAYAIVFKTSDFDYVFRLEIPIIKHMNVDNMGYTRYGTLGFGFEESECSWVLQWNSYNLRDFKDAIHEMITSEKYKKHVSVDSLNVE